MVEYHLSTNDIEHANIEVLVNISIAKLRAGRENEVNDNLLKDVST